MRSPLKDSGQRKLIPKIFHPVGGFCISRTLSVLHTVRTTGDNIVQLYYCWVSKISSIVWFLHFLDIIRASHSADYM